MNDFRGVSKVVVGSVATNRVEPNSSSRLICSSRLEQNLSGLELSSPIWVSHHAPLRGLHILTFSTTAEQFDLNYVFLDRQFYSRYDGTKI